MAGLAVLVAAAVVGMSNGGQLPGSYRCNPSIDHLPCSGGMRVGVRYRLDLDTDCGVVDAWFDGRRWVAKPRLTDGSDNPPSGWSVPWQRGTITLMSRAVAVFRAGRLTAPFRPAPRLFGATCRGAPMNGPPPAYVTRSSGSTRLAWGSYCWRTGRSGMCADMIPAESRHDIPRLEVQPGETLTFQLGFLPTDATLMLTGAGGTTVLSTRLANARTIAWQAPPGFVAPPTDLLATLSVRATNGEAVYMVWLHF